MVQLEWDSNFWKKDIYKINDDFIIDTDELKDIAQSKEWLVQALIPQEKVETIHLFEDIGFRFIETKVNLFKTKVENIKSVDESQYKKVTIEDVACYRNCFYELFGENSRFHVFDSQKVNDFYYTWVINSIEGTMDDDCIGFYDADILAGFITYKVVNEELIIGLFGVFPAYQGKKISTKLLDWIANRAIEKGCNQISVATQGKNTIALNTYIKNGYLIKNLQDWYYLNKWVY